MAAKGKGRHPTGDDAPDEVTEVTQGGEAADEAAAEPDGSAEAADEAPEAADETPAPDEATSVTAVTAAAGDEATAVATGAAEDVTAVAGETTTATKVSVVPAETIGKPKRRRGGKFRAVLVGILIALALLAVIVSGVTIWTHYTVFNTTGYMKLVGPIGKDPQAIKALSDYVAGQVITATDLQNRIQNALPAQVQLFAGPITGYVNDFISKGTQKVLSTPQAYQLWLKLNTVAHDDIVALLRGQTTRTYIQGDTVKLNTLPLISQVLQWILQKLPGGLSSAVNAPVIQPGTDPATDIQQVSQWLGKPLPADFGQITLLQSSSLGPAQKAVKIFDTLVWVLPIITVALFALSIWLSRRRRRTAIILGIGTAVAILVTRVIVKRASVSLVDSLHQQSGLKVVGNVVNAALTPLTNITIWIVVLGILLAIVAWVIGRRDVQTAAVAVGKRATGRAAELRIPDSPVTSWVARHALSVRWGVLIVGLILLVLLTPSWGGIAIIVVLVLLFEAILSMLTGQWPFNDRTEKPEPEDAEES